MVRWPRGAPGLRHLRPKVGHGPTPAQDVDFDGHRTAGHLGHERGVDHPEGLGAVAQRVGHGPEGDGGHHAPLGEGAQVPRVVDDRLVELGGHGGDRGRREEVGRHDQRWWR